MPRREVALLITVAAAIIVALTAVVTAYARVPRTVHTANSTAYCLTGLMADGTHTRPGSAASNRHPLGTRIRLERPGPDGRRLFVVRDRIGYGSELDLWTGSCGQARQYGRRDVRYRIGWRGAPR